MDTYLLAGTDKRKSRRGGRTLTEELPVAPPEDEPPMPEPLFGPVCAETVKATPATVTAAASCDLKRIKFS